MAAPTYRGKGTYGSGTTSAVADIDGIAGHSLGDLLLIVVESSDSTTAAGTPNTPTDWTKIFEGTEGGGATGVTTLTVFAKLHDGSEADVTVDGVLNHLEAQMYSVSAGTHGVTNVATDIVVGARSSHGVGTTGLSTTGITVTADSLIFHIVGLTDDAADVTNVSNVVNTNLAAITERHDETVSTGAGGGFAVTTATCAGTTTGATTFDHDTAANSHSIHLGIPPASVVKEQLAATPAGVATVTGALSERVSLAASPAGVASVSAALSERVALAASTLGAAIVSADLSGTEAGAEALAATVAGVATVSANLTERLGRAASPAGVAVVTAGLTERLGLQATVAGVAVVTADLRERLSLAAVSAGAAVVTADLSGTSPAASFNVNTQGHQQPPVWVITNRNV